MVCAVCPRKCNTDREKAAGFCGAGENLKAARAFLHKWEEPCISGTRGSGTVFFTGCNLKCVFCQNYHISQENYGKEISIDRLAAIFLELQEKGAHNINLVTPSHYVRQIYNAINKAQGLSIPVVYNSNGYDSADCLEIMKDAVDIYLPDLKYYSRDLSYRYSGASDYFDVASKAICEMYKQAGPSVLDNEGVMKKGVIIRHLILPGHTDDSIKLLEWIHGAMPEDIYISLMCQYTPYHRSSQYPEIDRRITSWEYEKVLNKFYKLGFKNGYIQERDAASEEYIPDFNLEGIL